MLSLFDWYYIARWNKWHFFWFHNQSMRGSVWFDMMSFFFYSMISKHCSSAEQFSSPCFGSANQHVTVLRCLGGGCAGGCNVTGGTSKTEEIAGCRWGTTGRNGFEYVWICLNMFEWDDVNGICNSIFRKYLVHWNFRGLYLGWDTGMVPSFTGILVHWTADFGALKTRFWSSLFVSLKSAQ